MGTNLRKRENKWISTGKNRNGVTNKRKRETNGLVQVKKETGGTNLRKRENKWISTGKNRERGTNLRQRENKWISTGKNGGRGDQPKEKRKQKDKYW